jgi:cytochrome c oxidase cbb3-type subunit 3
MVFFGFIFPLLPLRLNTALHQKSTIAVAAATSVARKVNLFLPMKRAMCRKPAISAVVCLIVLTLAGFASAQDEAPGAVKRQGGFVPGQKRAPEDPATVKRGKTLFEINCRGCHGPDLRGGDMGGPNLLRSPVALTDQHGELIVPIIHGSRQTMGMPAININDADAQAAAAYVRSVIASIEVQGKPPSEGHVDPSILVGNASEGKAYFEAKCSGCHSATGDMKAFVTRTTDQKRMQSTWIAGGRESEEISAQRTPTAEVTLPSGEKISGLVVQIDEFLVTLKLADGTERSVNRISAVDPPITIHDPMQKHREMLSEYTDRDIHDVTAYLETLK